MGREFGDFVGNPQRWARLLWNRYEALKHRPTLSYDAHELHLLAESARVLLTCALINRVAGTKAPTRALCRATQNHNLGYDVREW